MGNEFYGKVIVDGPKIVGKIDLTTIKDNKKPKKRKKKFVTHEKYCCYCERPFSAKLKPTREHLVPVSKGGSDKQRNIKPACLECNQLRANHSYRVFLLIIRAVKTCIKNKYTYTVEDLERVIKNIKVNETT